MWLFGRRDLAAGGRLCGQGGDLGQVVGQDSVSGLDLGALGAVDHAAVPSVVAFEVADPVFAAGSPFHGSAERLFRSASCRALVGLPLQGITTWRMPSLCRSSSTGGFAVAAVSSHRARCPAGAFDHVPQSA